jgi:hypothetical protein
VSGLLFLVLAGIVSGGGILFLYVRNRDTASLDNGVTEFQREMRALSPDKRSDDRRRGTPT